jgi:tetratricopeptide (TPR) repeat protein
MVKGASDHQSHDLPERLVSWKVIATELGCDERTAKRWERERGLPVHRVPGSKRSVVFAFRSELDNWLKTAPNRDESALTFSNLGFQTDRANVQHAAARVSQPWRSDGESWVRTREHAQDSRSGTRLQQRQAGENDLGNLAFADPPFPSKGESRTLDEEVGGQTGDDAANVPISTVPAHSNARFGWPGWLGICLAATVVLAWWILNSRPAVRAKASGNSQSSLAFQHVPVPDAEKLYNRGQYFWNLRTADSLTKAVDAYTQAIVKDPSYAEPYAGLAESYDLMPQFAGSDLGEAFARAESAAERAIQLNPNLAAAHRAKAFALFFWDWDFAGSDAEFKRALALDPNSAESHHWYASTLLNRHEGQESMRQIDEALRLNPTSTAIAIDAAFIHAAFGDFNAGVKALRELDHTQPTLASSSDFLRTIEFAEGEYLAYIADTRRYALTTGNPDDLATADNVARGWAEGGKIAMLNALLRAQEIAFKHGTETGFRLGQTYILLGHPDKALPYFDASLKKHFIMLITMRDCNWAKDLTADPGYAKLFEEIRKRMHRGYPAHPAVVPAFENLSQ